MDADNHKSPSFLEKYAAATVLLLGLIFYFLLILQYIRFSPYAHIPILDARSYWQLALEVAHNG
jgi:hypothetical protein